jgi:hypothetical protein
LFLLVSACATSDPGTDSAAARPDTAAAAGGEPVIYQPADSALSGFGSVAVTVSTSDSAMVDTTVFPIRDFETCGPQLTDNSIDREGSLVSGVIVWLAGITKGKQLPLSRRYEIVHQRCLLWPRAQAVAVGGTLNIRNMDGALHVLKFTDVASGEVLARVTQSERGQLVPNEYMLVVPRVIEVVCETHPWTKGWIHVFDHPYYASTNRMGIAVLDSVPAGPHQLMLWHERAADIRDSLTVTAGERVQRTLELRKK